MKSFAIALALLATTAAPAAFAQAPAAAPAAEPAYSTAKTPLGDLIANPATDAVLEKHIPGISKNPQIQPVLGLPLKSIQQYAPDKLPDTLLAAIDVDLAKVPAPAK